MENPKALKPIDELFTAIILQNDHYYEAQKFLAKSKAQHLMELLAGHPTGKNTFNDQGFYFTMIPFICGMIATCIFGAITKCPVETGMKFWLGFGILSETIGQIPYQIFLKRRRAKFEKTRLFKEAWLDNELERQNRLINDPNVLKAINMKNEINELNKDLGQFNIFMNKIDDFRELTEKELNQYNELAKRRKNVGAKMLIVEKELTETALKSKSLPPVETPTIPSIEILDRHQLEQEIEITIQKIEATDAERNAAVTHLDELNSQLDAMTGHRLLA